MLNAIIQAIFKCPICGAGVLLDLHLGLAPRDEESLSDQGGPTYAWRRALSFLLPLVRIDHRRPPGLMFWQSDTHEARRMLVLKSAFTSFVVDKIARLRSALRP